jgi:hypothetical protein
LPFTLSHPAAVLPLRRIFPRLNFAALLIGSIIPDIGYYIPGLAAHRQTHSLAGIVFPGLPIGLLMLALLHLLQRPLCFVLPQPHRGALTALAAEPRRWTRLASPFIAAASVLLGAWTHLVWDGFTHRGRWGTQHFAFLNDPALSIGGQAIPLYEWLQWLSSVAGGLILLWAYRSWLRRQAGPPLPSADSGEERWRCFLLGGLGLAAITASLPYAWDAAARFQGLTARAAFLFQLWVHFAVFYAGLLALSAMLLFRLARDAET